MPISRNQQQSRPVVEPPSNVSLGYRLVLEVLVAGSIVLFGGAAVIAGVTSAKLNNLDIGLAFGLTLTLWVVIAGGISGAHGNSLLTIFLAVLRQHPWKEVPAYIAAHLIGAISGACLLWFFYGNQARDKAHLAATYLAPGVTPIRGITVEALGSGLLLVAVVAAVQLDGAAKAAPGIALGLSVMLALPITGGAFNLDRAYGPMLVAWKFTDWKIYLIGDTLGMLIAIPLSTGLILGVKKLKKD